MKLVFINPTGILGGAEMCLLDLLASLRTSRPDWSLRVVLGDEGPLEHEVAELGVPCDVLTMPRALSAIGDAHINLEHGGQLALAGRGPAAGVAAVCYLKQLRRVLRSERFDCVQTNGMKAHILGAVNVLVAAKSGDKSKLAQAETEWFANGREIADFLHAADPRFLSRSAARRMMNIHLTQVIQQGVDELTGNYLADARAFAPYIRHILDMADMISSGIISQFPARFR